LRLAKVIVKNKVSRFFMVQCVYLLSVEQWPCQLVAFHQLINQSVICYGTPSDVQGRLTIK